MAKDLICCVCFAEGNTRHAGHTGAIRGAKRVLPNKNLELPSRKVERSVPADPGEVGILEISRISLRDDVDRIAPAKHDTLARSLSQLSRITLQFSKSDNGFFFFFYETHCECTRKKFLRDDYESKNYVFGPSS